MYSIKDFKHSQLSFLGSTGILLNFPIISITIFALELTRNLLSDLTVLLSYVHWNYEELMTTMSVVTFDIFKAFDWVLP